MEVLLSPDALRAARNLAGLSQRELGDVANIARGSIVAAESSSSPSSPTTLKLRSFYEARGMEFIGTVNLATGVAKGLGVRWRMPSQLPPDKEVDRIIHTERSGLAFAAARGLLNRKQSEIVALSKIPEHKIRALEAKKQSDEDSVRRLRNFYEESGIQFLGWGDVTRDVFYGVGVQWTE
jgi:transcriptional regulator with XRE-family HTH domain